MPETELLFKFCYCPKISISGVPKNYTSKSFFLPEKLRGENLMKVKKRDA